MTPELHFLSYAIILGLLQMLGTALAGSLQNGLVYAMGPRDQQKPITGYGARVNRAFANFMETFPFFAAVILIAQAAGVHTSQTVFGAELYFWARVTYVPIYILGTPLVRTLIWLGSIVGMLLILGAVL